MLQNKLHVFVARFTEAQVNFHAHRSKNPSHSILFTLIKPAHLSLWDT